MVVPSWDGKRQWRHRQARCGVVLRQCDAVCTASMPKASRDWATDHQGSGPAEANSGGAQQLIALVRKAPPGRLERQSEGGWWRAKRRAQLSGASMPWRRRPKKPDTGETQSDPAILLREGVRWRQTHSWGTSHDPDFVPKEPRSSATTHSRPRARRPSAPMS